MTNERFTEIARNLFRTGNIQVLTNDEHKEIIKVDGDYIAFRELI